MLFPLAFVSAPRPATLDVANVEPGETVRYPLLLLRGSARGNSVIVGTSWKAMVKFPVADERFAAAVELKPGANFVLVQSARDLVKIQVNYRPMTTPYRVRAVYLLAKDESTEFDGPPGADRTRYRDKIDLALKMMQSVAGESMREAGYGRKTFGLELGPDGKVVVHEVRSEATGDTLRSLDGNTLWSRFNDDLSKGFDYGVDKVCGVMAFTRWDRSAKRPLGHTALGGGGLGLFGSGTMWSYPASVAEIPKVFGDATPVDPAVEMDDSGLRGTVWASAATGIGAMLHEMGHTFGLPHSADRRSVMLRGFDALNRRFVVVEPPRKGDENAHPVSWDDASHWDPFEAARLNLQPWFQPDGFRGMRFPGALPPRVTFEGEDVVVSSSYGLGLVGAVREGKAGVFREFKGDKTARIKRADLGEGEATVIAVDEDGNQTEAKLP